MSGIGLFGAQNAVFLVLTLAAFVLTVWALVDALRHPAGAYSAAGKLSKRAWGIILAVAVLLTFANIGGGLGFLVLISVVAAAVYLADVRPALRSVGGGPRGRSQGPSGW